MQDMTTVSGDFMKQSRVGVFKKFVKPRQVRRTKFTAFTSLQECVDALPVSVGDKTAPRTRRI